MAKRPTIEARILTACREAERQGFRIISEYRPLELRDNVYAPSHPERPECLPLADLLLGKPSCGGYEADIGKELGVSVDWVMGFLAGFARRPGMEPYREGYPEGLRFRERHYPAESLGGTVPKEHEGRKA